MASAELEDVGSVLSLPVVEGSAVLAAVVPPVPPAVVVLPVVVVVCLPVMLAPASPEPEFPSVPPSSELDTAGPHPPRNPAEATTRAMRTEHFMHADGTLLGGECRLE